MSDETELSLWTIYRQPRDYPHGYVLRRHVASAKGSRPTEDAFYAYTLAEIRLLVPPGLVCIGREDGDEPQIVETWL